MGEETQRIICNFCDHVETQHTIKRLEIELEASLERERNLRNENAELCQEVCTLKSMIMKFEGEETRIEDVGGVRKKKQAKLNAQNSMIRGIKERKRIAKSCPGYTGVGQRKIRSLKKTPKGLGKVTRRNIILIKSPVISIMESDFREKITNLQKRISSE